MNRCCIFWVFAYYIWNFFYIITVFGKDLPNVCADIVAGKSQIRLIGYTESGNNILILSEQWQGYEVPYGSLNSEEFELNLEEAEPFSIETRWPALNDTPEFISIKDKKPMLFGFTVIVNEDIVEMVSIDMGKQFYGILKNQTNIELTTVQTAMSSNDSAPSDTNTVDTSSQVAYIVESNSFAEPAYISVKNNLEAFALRLENSTKTCLMKIVFVATNPVAGPLNMTQTTNAPGSSCVELDKDLQVDLGIYDNDKGIVYYFHSKERKVSIVRYVINGIAELKDTKSFEDFFHCKPPPTIQYVILVAAFIAIIATILGFIMTRDANKQYRAASRVAAASRKSSKKSIAKTSSKILYNSEGSSLPPSVSNSITPTVLSNQGVSSSSSGPRSDIKSIT